jgi:hypothetical protein
MKILQFVALGAERNSAMRRADLADLTAFVAVADNLSFRAAASRLGATPSALSHTVRHFEERLGIRLLNRTTRSVSLTAGQRIARDPLCGRVNALRAPEAHPGVLCAVPC